MSFSYSNPFPRSFSPLQEKGISTKKECPDLFEPDLATIKLFDDDFDIHVEDWTRIDEILETVRGAFGDDDVFFTAIEDFSKVQATHLPSPISLPECEREHCIDKEAHKHVCKPCGHTHDSFKNSQDCSNNCSRMHAPELTGEEFDISKLYHTSLTFDETGYYVWHYTWVGKNGETTEGWKKTKIC